MTMIELLTAMNRVNCKLTAIYLDDGTRLPSVEAIAVHFGAGWYCLQFSIPKIQDKIVVSAKDWNMFDHPNDDMLKFDRNFELTAFVPREMNQFLIKLRAVGAGTDLQWRMSDFAFDRSQAKDRLNKFRPKHNLKWLEK